MKIVRKITHSQNKLLKMALSVFRWVPEGWRECTKKCGGGKQKRKIMCRQKHSMAIDKEVKKKFCKNLPKPIKKRPCNSHHCPPRWFTAKWSKVKKKKKKKNSV